MTHITATSVVTNKMWNEIFIYIQNYIKYAIVIYNHQVASAIHPVDAEENRGTGGGRREGGKEGGLLAYPS